MATSLVLWEPEEWRWSQEEEPEHRTGNKEGSIKESSKAGGKVFLGKGIWGAVQQREQG